MDKQTIRRRNAHALEELRNRGALRSGALPPGLRLAMRLFPDLRAPYYGSRWAYAAILGVLFALPMGGFICWILSMDGQYSTWWGIVLGSGAGAGFGAIYTGYMAAVHRRMRLTPWDQLDHPPGGETPEGSETFGDVTSDYVRRFSRMR